MNFSAKASLPPLIQTHAKVIERDAIGIKTLAVAAVHSDKLGREVQHLPELCFLLPDLFLGPLLFAQIEHECDTLVPTFKQRTSNQHGHAGAIFPEKLFLVRLSSSNGLQTRQGTLVALVPFGRCQISPEHSTRDEILTAVLQHVQKGVLGIDDLLTFDSPD